MFNFKLKFGPRTFCLPCILHRYIMKQIKVYLI